MPKKKSKVRAKKKLSSKQKEPSVQPSTSGIKLHDQTSSPAWSDKFYLEAYTLARRGFVDKKIAERFRVELEVLEEWISSKPALADAIKTGRDLSARSKWIHLRPKQRAFLVAYSRLGNITQAAEASNITRKNHVLWMQKDGDLRDPGSYASCFTEAREDAIDRLEGEAFRRATDGVATMKFHQGQPIMVPCLPSDPDAHVAVDENGNRCFLKPYLEYKQSDNLLMFLLKANRRNLYADEPIQLNQTQVINLNDMISDIENKPPTVIDANFINQKANELIEHHNNSTELNGHPRGDTSNGSNGKH